jgi:GMP synthase (glutamine-hydrolysing)
MKKALIVRHVPREGAAGFLQPIEAAGYEIERIDVASPEFADVDLCTPDLLIMMGGPMGVYEHDIHPWIPVQVGKLAARLEQDLPTLGVCLGSQMIAAALGARVYPGEAMELGFAPVTLNGAGAESPLRHIQDVPVLHWHSDTFELPRGVELLASTNAYAHQAFRRGRNSTPKWVRTRASVIGSPISGPIWTSPGNAASPCAAIMMNMAPQPWRQAVR